MPAAHPSDRKEKSTSGWRLICGSGLQGDDKTDRIALHFVDSSGIPLTSANLRIDELATLFGQILRPHAELLLDGSIAIELEFAAEPRPEDEGPDIAQLVSRALAPEMLEDEPDVKGQLATLRQRLRDALALVDRTMADLDKPA